MNKVFCRKRLFFSFLLAGYLILFNTSCGLDTFYELKEPRAVIHQPDCTSIDYSESYFEFYSADKPDPGVPVTFLGTEVYYKIYKSSSQLKSDVESIQAIANKDSQSSAPADAIINKNYRALRGAAHKGDNVLITDSDKKVHIRLSDYQLYPAQIIIDDTNNIGKPVRDLDKTKYFNFKSSDTDTIPVSSDVDTSTSGSSSDDDWYVAMFAVAVGNDVNYSPIYSNVLYLGSVRIPLE